MTDSPTDIEEARDVAELGDMATGVIESIKTMDAPDPKRSHPLDVVRGCGPEHPEYLEVYLPAIGAEVVVPSVTVQDEFSDTVDHVTDVVVLDGEAYVRLRRTPGLLHQSFVRPMRPLLSEFAVIVRACGAIWAVPMDIMDRNAKALSVMPMSGVVERQAQLETLSDDLDQLLDLVMERTGAPAIHGAFSFATRNGLLLDLAYVRYFEPTTKRELRNAERAVRAHVLRKRDATIH